MNGEYNALVNKFAADKQQTGFLYQFCLLIHCIFGYSLEETDRIVYEGEDDITIYYHNEKIHLIQAKHSVQGEAESISNMDPSFWKTINNWLKLKDAFQNDNNKNSFFENRRFRLVTNKAINNEFWNRAQFVKNGTTEISDIQKYLKQITTENDQIKDCVERLLKLKSQELRQFVMNFDVEIIADPFKKAKEALNLVCIDSARADDLLNQLLGKLSLEFYDDVTNSIKFDLTIKEFIDKFKPMFVSEKNLPEYVSEYNDIEIPENISSMNMSRQLEIVNLIKGPDFLPKQYKHFYSYNRNVADNIQKCIWQESDNDRFETEAQSHWEPIHEEQKANYEYTDRDKDVAAKHFGAICFQRTMQKDFLQMPLNFCKGCYLKLSDDLKIGWHMEWEKHMKKQNYE